MNPFSDIAFFSLLIKKGSLYSAAQEIGGHTASSE